MNKKVLWEHIEQQEDKIIDSPAGLLTVNNSVFQYDFWLIHTNFPIKRSVKKKLDTIEGVESLNIISPYRMIVSIAKMYSSQRVKLEIENFLTEKVDIGLETLKMELSQFEDWIIYICPNDEISYATKNDEDFTELVELFENTKKTVGGQILRPIYNG